MESNRKIQKVSPRMRKRETTFENNYDPIAVSIGPYHHEDKNLWLGDEIKIKFIQHFIQSDTHKTNMFNAIFKNINFFRSFYVIEHNENYYNDKYFAEMMLLDGCFLLHFLECISDPTKESDLLILTPMGVGEVLRDIFLLENQLPYAILQLLMSFKYEEHNWETILNRSIKNISFWKAYPIDFKVIQMHQPPPFHLLDILWSYYNVKADQEPSTPTNHEAKDLDHMLADSRNYVQSMLTVKELKAKGIYLNPSTKTTTCNIFTYVKFESFNFYGALQVPGCIIKVTSKPILLNLIAYEMCSGTLFLPPKVASYVSFMRSLIDDVEDVKEMEARGIILNCLGSDEEVVKMFKEVDIAPYFFLEFRVVAQSIHKHANNKAKTLIAELISTYFRSPWTAIALFGSILVIVLTFLQTYLTINPKKSNDAS